jgi:hypothetical protein
VTGRELAVARGWADTRTTLAEWNRAPLAAVGPWLLVSLAIAAALLVSVLAVALLSKPDPTYLMLPGVEEPGTLTDVRHVLVRNLLVLALHAMACLAGFIAKSSLPIEAAGYTGIVRWLHDRAGTAAMIFVGGATAFSLTTQAYVLGGALATLAPQMGLEPGKLLLCLLPHALPELVALFLPLAAWMVAARAGAWEKLMAATVTTTALALPVIAVAALIEVYGTPALLRSLHFV